MFDAHSKLITDRLDLSAFAREHTGPLSWSAHPEAEWIAAWALAAHDRGLGAPSWHVDISPDDVPRVNPEASERVRSVLKERESFVLAAIDGTSNLGELAESLAVETPELVKIIDRLCVVGLVELHRHGRGVMQG